MTENRKGGGRSDTILSILICPVCFWQGIIWHGFSTKGVVSPWLFFAGITAMPPLYFFFAALNMKNYAAIIPCIIFTIVQIAIISSSYIK